MMGYGCSTRRQGCRRLPAATADSQFAGLLELLLIGVCLASGAFPKLAPAADPPAAQSPATQSPAAQPPVAEQAVPAETIQEVDQLIVNLDAAEFAERERAAQRLAKLASDPALREFLSVRFHRALLAEETSFEVRATLEALVRSLPAPPVRIQTPDVAAIGPLLDQLKSDQHLERDSAVRRLAALLDYEELIAPVWSQMKQRISAPDASASERRLLAPLVERAHESWLRSSLVDAPLPRPTAEQMQTLVGQLIKPADLQTLDLFERTPAESELLDLIARNDTRDEVLALLNKALESDPDSAVHDKLRYLIDFSKPAMAAEAWNSQINGTVQYLIIDVPQYNDALSPPRATHFDRIDDNTAHCVSGNSLTAGDYPVRVGIPHPEPGRDAMFYLTNLPTPRSRLAYEYSLRRDESVRLAEITDRTLEYFLKRKAPLSEVEVLLLAQLEPHAVSRFVGKYFELIPDAPLRSASNGLSGQATVYAGMCAIMNRVGTNECVPALEKLARSGALGKPEYPSRVDVAWVAILAIATRDPWPNIDDWLIGLIDEVAPLTTDPDQPPELGASAAGLLLDRHGASVRPFGLATAGEAVTDAFQFYGYRFTSDRDRSDVKRWWKKQQTIAAAAKDSPLTGPQEPARGFVPRALENAIPR
jgi:hypothetical protein